MSADAHYDATVEAAERLVHRPQDLPKTVEGQIQHYKENVLRQLEVSSLVYCTVCVHVHCCVYLHACCNCK